MKKKIALFLATILAVSTLAACGNTNASTSSSASSTPASSVSNEPAASSGDGSWSKTITLSDGTVYPKGTVTIIAPFAAGGGVDLGDRLFAKYAQQYTDATIIVENITGGSGLVGIQTGLSRKADGYTMWHQDPGAQYINTSTAASCPFDVLNDMTLVGNMVADDRVWVIRPDETRFTTGEELLAYAKDHPGEVSVASSGAATIAALATSYFADAMGLEFNTIGYNGSSEAKSAFLGGHCDVMSAGVSEVDSMLKENQCSIMFTLTDEPIYDGVPTLNELGGTDLVSLSTLRGFAMSKDVDPQIVAYWSSILEMVTSDPAFVEEAASLGFNIRYYDTEGFTQVFEEYNPIWLEIKENLGL